MSFISVAAIASAIVLLISTFSAIVPLMSGGLMTFVRQQIMSAMRLLPERKMTWGTVYDSHTKRPVPFAKVQLLDHHRRVLETRIADTKGRYGFLSTPESLIARGMSISIMPSHDGYRFPSRAPVSIDRFVYNNLYYGGEVPVNDQQLINFDIPMDPVKPSAAPLLATAPSIVLGAGVAVAADAGFWLGVVIIPLSFILTPNPFTFGTLCLFLGTASLRLFGISEHPYGTVVDAATGHAMSFALLTLDDPTGKRIAFAVSDERGRYFIVTERGEYELSVFTPATIVPPRKTTTHINAKKGWVTRELKV